MPTPGICLAVDRDFHEHLPVRLMLSDQFTGAEMGLAARLQ
jgi:hypothetical protein